MFAKYFYTWLKHSRMQQDFRMQERIVIFYTFVFFISADISCFCVSTTIIMKPTKGVF